MSVSSILNNFGSFGSDLPIPMFGTTLPSLSGLGSSASSLLKNNANHFGSFGSDLPGPVLEQVVRKEHEKPGSSGAEELVNEFSNAIADSQGNSPYVSYPNSAYGGSSSSSTKADIAKADFLNAELAEYYGMTRGTAYQEALSNTAYQRAVRDMKDAGLNPAVLFGAGHAQSSNSSLYAAEERSGSGGGGFSRSSGSGGKSKNGKLFSSSAYGAISSAAGLIGSVATKNPGNYWVFNSIAQGAMNFANALWQSW